MTMLMMDPWINESRGGGRRKTLVMKGKKRPVKEQLRPL
jgi:hypothetical protein